MQKSRIFLITYKLITARTYELNPSRTIKVEVSAPSNNLSIDSQRALNIFISTCGDLHKNDIISIQEIDENNNPLGDPIVPMDDTTVVPVK